MPVVFLGCPEAEKKRDAFAAATCPKCLRKGRVPVTTAQIVHKTMLCADCSAKHPFVPEPGGGATGRCFKFIGTTENRQGVLVCGEFQDDKIHEG